MRARHSGFTASSSTFHDVHDPDVAQVLFPGKVQIFPVRCQGRRDQPAALAGEIGEWALGAVCQGELKEIAGWLLVSREVGRRRFRP